MKKHRLFKTWMLFILVPMCLLILVFSQSCKTGTVKGITMDKEGKILTVVRLDIGIKVKAIPLADSATGSIKITGEQRVRVKYIKEHKHWGVVEFLDKDD